MQLNRGNQLPKKNKATAEYEIKTYGSTAANDKSPAHSYNPYKRSPKRREIIEGHNGERPI